MHARKKYKRFLFFRNLILFLSIFWKRAEWGLLYGQQKVRISPLPVEEIPLIAGLKKTAVIPPTFNEIQEKTLLIRVVEYPFFVGI